MPSSQAQKKSNENPSGDILFIEGLSISYGKNDVVKDIDLQIYKGEIFGLIGLNGAGKTTIIKSILGLRRQQAGTITIAGCSSLNKQARQDVVYLPERFEPPWFLTGMEFIDFSLKIYGQKRSKNQAEDCAVKLALDPDVLGSRVQTYSKGMRQKLGLIATIMTQRQLMILDEPMSGLDPQARALVKDMLVEAHNQGQTIFMSSHILVDMDEMCDRVSILHDGNIQFTGAPSDFKERTKTKSLEQGFLQIIK